MNRLFVYGIFLDERNRDRYGMSNPSYATVKNYVTLGSTIVSAYKTEDDQIALTGLVVDVDPSRWSDIDLLEGAYHRKLVDTTDGERVYMYVDKYSN